MIRQSAEVENDMNSVERVLHYATSVEQEAANEVPEKKPPAPWPSRGEIELKDIVLKYRPGLPAVIKGLYSCSPLFSPKSDRVDQVSP
jgi:ABC-type bacteriocin/lantibiotic exporter with double-glycine peptidase domain